MRLVANMLLLLLTFNIFGQQPRLVIPFSEEGLWQAKFSPDGKKILTAGIRLMVWDVMTGKLITKIQDFSTNFSFTSVDFSPDSKRVVTNGLANAYVWDISSGKKIVSLTGHRRIVNTVQYSLDGKRIVTSSDDSSVNIWNAITGKAILQLKGFKDKVSEAHFSNDGKKVITLSWDSTERIWDAINGRLLKAFSERKVKENIRNIEISADSKMSCLVLDSYILIINNLTGENLLRINEHLSNFFEVKFTSDGRNVVIADIENKYVKVFEISTGEQISRFSITGDFFTINSDGNSACLYSKNVKFTIINVLTDKVISEYPVDQSVPENYQCHAIFSQNGKYICTIPAGVIDITNSADIWEVKSGVRLSQLQGQGNRRNREKNHRSKNSYRGHPEQ